MTYVVKCTVAHASGGRTVRGGKWVLGLVAALVATSLVPTTRGLANTPPIHSSTTALLRYSPLYMAGGQRYTQAQAVALAQRYAIISEHSGVFTPYISAMKGANPTLKIVAYLNGTFDKSNTGTTYPSSWYAYDAHGKRIRSVAFGNYMMNPANPLWPPTVARLCSGEIASSKYDGCLVDTLGTGPLGSGYSTGYPINPTSRKPFTLAEWMRATTTIAATVQSANSQALVVPNGLGDGAKYFDTTGGATRPLVATTGIGMAEIWLRIARNPVNQYPSQAQWKQDVDMLVDAEAHGWSILTTVKLWTTASSAQQLAWHRYALASFLLGASGSCAFSFSTSQTAAGLTADSTYDHAAIGLPTGPYQAQGGAYQRHFTHGLVAVNPTSSPVTLPLGGAYHNLVGATVTSETLPPNSGDVFVV